MMIKPVSILAITIVGVMSAFPSNGAQMTSQIQRLLEQKEEKIKKLEECEGKKQGWMIAGISTIGLTAVGVGVNIAQASKSNKLSGEIEQSKKELERQQERLSKIKDNISKEGKKEGSVCYFIYNYNCCCGEEETDCPCEEEAYEEAYGKYKNYKLSCEQVVFEFIPKYATREEVKELIYSLRKECNEVVPDGWEMVSMGMDIVKYECKGYMEKMKCGTEGESKKAVKKEEKKCRGEELYLKCATGGQNRNLPGFWLKDSNGRDTCCVGNEEVGCSCAICEGDGFLGENCAISSGVTGKWREKKDGDKICCYRKGTARNGIVGLSVKCSCEQ